MDGAAKITSKGRVTVPKSVRDALELNPGDTVRFRVADDHAVLVKIPDFIDLAASVKTPDSKRGLAWSQQRDSAWRSRSAQIASIDLS